MIVHEIPFHKSIMHLYVLIRHLANHKNQEDIYGAHDHNLIAYLLVISLIINTNRVLVVIIY